MEYATYSLLEPEVSNTFERRPSSGELSNHTMFWMPFLFYSYMGIKYGEWGNVLHYSCETTEQKILRKAPQTYDISWKLTSVLNGILSFRHIPKTSNDLSRTRWLKLNHLKVSH